MRNYQRSISELEKKAVFWWPSFLSTQETNASIIPMLIESQDKFLSLLTLSDISPEKIENKITQEYSKFNNFKYRKTS